MLAAIFVVILSPIWVVFFIPRRLLPDGEATFFMLGLCYVVLPAIPAQKAALRRLLYMMPTIIAGE